jgi:hypothetical protein
MAGRAINTAELAKQRQAETLDVETLTRERDEARAEVERLKGLTPELLPYPPIGSGMPRYGLRWSGPEAPLSVPMDDGYWTPWHMAQAEVDRLKAELSRPCVWTLERDDWATACGHKGVAGVFRGGRCLCGRPIQEEL